MVASSPDLIDELWDAPSGGAAEEAPPEAAPVAGASASSDEWWVRVDSAEVVEMATADVVTAIRAGRLNAKSPVWRDGMADWATAEDVPLFRLAALGARSNPPPPSPAADEAPILTVSEETVAPEAGLDDTAPAEAAQTDPALEAEPVVDEAAPAETAAGVETPSPGAAREETGPAELPLVQPAKRESAPAEAMPVPAAPAAGSPRSSLHPARKPAAVKPIGAKTPLVLKTPSERPRSSDLLSQAPSVAPRPSRSEPASSRPPPPRRSANPPPLPVRSKPPPTAPDDDDVTRVMTTETARRVIEAATPRHEHTLTPTVKRTAGDEEPVLAVYDRPVPVLAFGELTPDPVVHHAVAPRPVGMPPPPPVVEINPAPSAAPLAQEVVEPPSEPEPAPEVRPDSTDPTVGEVWPSSLRPGTSRATILIAAAAVAAASIIGLAVHSGSRSRRRAAVPPPPAQVVTRAPAVSVARVEPRPPAASIPSVQPSAAPAETTPPAPVARPVRAEPAQPAAAPVARRRARREALSTELSNAAQDSVAQLGSSKDEAKAPEKAAESRSGLEDPPPAKSFNESAEGKRKVLADPGF